MVEEKRKYNLNETEKYIKDLKNDIKRINKEIDLIHTRTFSNSSLGAEPVDGGTKRNKYDQYMIKLDEKKLIEDKEMLNRLLNVATEWKNQTITNIKELDVDDGYIVEQYLRGRTVISLSIEYKCSKNTIYRILEKYDCVKIGTKVGNYFQNMR